jgi:hypothetical protein
MSDIPVEKLVATYRKIKAKKDELEAAHKQQVETLTTQMDTIKTALLEHCKEHNVESVRTEAGTFYRSIKTRYWTNDWPSFGDFVVAQSIPELYEKRINQGAMAQFIEENPDVQVPGLNIDREYTLTVRKS